MILIFIACLLPLLGLQMLIQAWGTNLIRQQVYSSAYANVDYLNSHFCDNIGTLRTTLEYIRDVDTVRQFFVYSNSYDSVTYYSKVAEIQEFLYRMCKSNPFIGEIHLYLPRSSLLIASDGRLKQHQRCDAEEIEKRIAAYRNASSLIIEEDGEYRICTALGNISADSEFPPALYLEILLDQEVMVQHLSSFTASGEKLSLQYNHDADTALFSDGTHLSNGQAKPFDDALQQINQQSYSASFRLDGADYVLIASYAPEIHASFGQLILVSDLESIPSMLRTGMLLFVVAFALMLTILSVLMNRQVNHPTKRLLTAFDATGAGKFETRIRDNLKLWPIEYQQLAHHFNDMNQHTEELIENIYMQQYDLRQAQLKQLQAQINPHFLYNSFFLLRNIISTGDSEQADCFLVCLGRYFQYITNNTSEAASLEEEYAHAQNYLSIQLMRFEDMLELDIAPLPEHLRHISVPRLMMQPLYENVLVHGTWNDGKIRRICLRIEENDSLVRLRICDNGDGITNDLIENVRTSLTSNIPYEFTSGLTNIHHRLSLFFKKGGLDVGRSHMGGFEVIITIMKER